MRGNACHRRSRTYGAHSFIIRRHRSISNSACSKRGSERWIVSSYTLSIGPKNPSASAKAKPTELGSNGNVVGSERACMRTCLYMVDRGWPARFVVVQRTRQCNATGRRMQQRPATPPCTKSNSRARVQINPSISSLFFVRRVPDDDGKQGPASSTCSGGHGRSPSEHRRACLLDGLLYHYAYILIPPSDPAATDSAAAVVCVGAVATCAGSRHAAAAAARR